MGSFVGCFFLYPEVKKNSPPNSRGWVQQKNQTNLNMSAPPARLIWLVSYDAADPSITPARIAADGILRASQCFTTLLDATTKCTLLHFGGYAYAPGFTALMQRMDVHVKAFRPFAKDREGLDDLHRHPAYNALIAHRIERKPSFEAFCTDDAVDSLLAPPKKPASDKCEHGKRKFNCKPCGGFGICVHNRIKYRCKECKGSAICKHGERRYRCPECTDKSECPHGSTRAECAKCFEISQMCEHDRLKTSCPQCHNNTKCEHDVIKRLCPTCTENKPAGATCQHGNSKYKCKECKPERICKHGANKHKCEACMSTGRCEHKKNKYFCKICKGPGICSHDKRRYRCKKCKESAAPDDDDASSTPSTPS